MMQTARWKVILIALLCGVLDVGPAWAVVGNVAVNVTGPTGPVAGAKVRIGDEVVTTDGQGRAELTVEEGARTVVIEHPDYVTRHQAVSVKGGERTRADFAMNFVLPFMAQNPGGRFGGFSIGPVGLVQSWALDVKREIETLSLVFAVPGTGATGTTTPTSTSATFENQSPNRFEIDVKAGGVDAALGLPGFSAFGWSFFPAVSGVVGGADVEIENTQTRNEMTGGGFLGSAGVELAVVPSSLPRSYLAVGWQGWWMNVDDMDFKIGGVDLCSAGAFASLQNCRYDTTLRSEAHDFYIKAGYGLLANHVAPFGGVKFRTSDLEFRSDVKGTLGTAEFRDKLEIDFEQGRCDCVMGLAGIDVRGPDIWEFGRLFGRVQTEFNGSGYSVLFKLMFGFGYVDP